MSFAVRQGEELGKLLVAERIRPLRDADSPVGDTNVRADFIVGFRGTADLSPVDEGQQRNPHRLGWVT